MATSKKAAPKLTPSEIKKVRDTLERTLTGLDPKVMKKIASGVGPRAAVDVNVCKTKPRMASQISASAPDKVNALEASPPKRQSVDRSKYPPSSVLTYEQRVAINRRSMPENRV